MSKSSFECSFTGTIQYPDNGKWSQDGYIAIVSSEQIQIFHPTFDSILPYSNKCVYLEWKKANTQNQPKVKTLNEMSNWVRKLSSVDELRFASIEWSPCWDVMNCNSNCLLLASLNDLSTMIFHITSDSINTFPHPSYANCDIKLNGMEYRPAISDLLNSWYCSDSKKTFACWFPTALHEYGTNSFSATLVLCQCDCNRVSLWILDKVMSPTYGSGSIDMRMAVVKDIREKHINDLNCNFLDSDYIDIGEISAVTCIESITSIESNITSSTARTIGYVIVGTTTGYLLLYPIVRPSDAGSDITLGERLAYHILQRSEIDKIVYNEYEITIAIFSEYYSKVFSLDLFLSPIHNGTGNSNSAFDTFPYNVYTMQQLHKHKVTSMASFHNILDLSNNNNNNNNNNNVNIEDIDDTNNITSLTLTASIDGYFKYWKCITNKNFTHDNKELLFLGNLGGYSPRANISIAVDSFNMTMAIVKKDILTQMQFESNAIRKKRNVLTFDYNPFLNPGKDILDVSIVTSLFKYMSNYLLDGTKINISMVGYLVYLLHGCELLYQDFRKSYKGHSQSAPIEYLKKKRKFYTPGLIPSSNGDKDASESTSTFHKDSTHTNMQLTDSSDSGRVAVDLIDTDEDDEDDNDASMNVDGDEKLTEKDKQLNHSKKDIQNAYDRIYLNIFVNLISAAAKCIGDTMGTSLHQPYLNQLQQSHPVIPLPHFLLHISTDENFIKYQTALLRSLHSGMSALIKNYNSNPNVVSNVANGDMYYSTIFLNHVRSVIRLNWIIKSLNSAIRKFGYPLSTASTKKNQKKTTNAATRQKLYTKFISDCYENVLTQSFLRQHMDFNKDSSTNNNEYDSSQQSQNIVIPSYEECRSLYIMGMALLNDIHNVVITEQSPDFTNILNDNGSHSIISLNRPLWTTSKIFTVINNIAMSALHISEIYINSQLYDTITNDNNSSDNTNTSQNILNQFQFKICFNCNNYVEISVKINEPSICTYCKFANDICARSLIPLTIHSVISQNTSSNLIDTIRPVKSCMLCKTYYQVDTFLVNDEELGVRNSVAFEWMLNESYCGFAMCMYCSISLSYS